MLTLQNDKCLAPMTTFGIGGPARFFIEVRTINDMQKAMQHCCEKKLPYLILGKGSNCLISDAGFDGLAILNKIDFCHQRQEGIFHVGSGYSFSLLGTQTARSGWSGLEFASGIPGSVGGAVYMNAGANGFETANNLVSVDFVTEKGLLITIQKNNLDFGYRSSSFQHMPGAIVGATFSLVKSEEARKKQMDIIQYRKKTQPLTDKSAGCVFRNPSCGHAGALIEQCGLKNFQIGGAMVSPIHANFIVNIGQATAKDVLALITIIKAKVKDTKGVVLESEIKYISATHDGHS